jgi:hypothetical protein
MHIMENGNTTEDGNALEDHNASKSINVAENTYSNIECGTYALKRDFNASTRSVLHDSKTLLLA